MDAASLLSLMQKQQEEHNKIVTKLMKDQQKQQAEFQAQQAEVHKQQVEAQKQQAEVQKQQAEIQKQQADRENVLIEMVKVMQRMGVNPKAEDAGDTSMSTGEISIPRLMAALSVRIAEFRFDPDSESTFTKWYDRHKNIFLVDGEKLDDAARVRLLTEKLHNSVFERYKRQILPKEPENIEFKETVDTLKELFDVKISIFTNRYQCLNITKTSSEDFMEYTGRVNEACEKSKVYDMDSDQFKCLLWVFGLKESKYSELRQRLMIILDKAHTENKKMTIHALYQEVEKYQSLKQDSKLVESGMPKTVYAVSHEKPKANIECWNCGGSHFIGTCPHKNIICRKCNKKGHQEAYCGVAAAKMKARENQQGSAQKAFRSKSKGPTHKKCKAVTIASATAEVNVVRQFVDMEVNDHTISFQLDTGSDITLIEENIWTQMGKPELIKSDVIVKDASGRQMKIHGRLECLFSLKGSSGRGFAYVTPHKSLLGLDWIRQSEQMNYHLERMVARVEKTSTDLVGELKEKFGDVFQEGLGRCKVEQAELTLMPDAKPVFRMKRPVPHAALEAVETELDRLIDMGVISQVTHSKWAAPIVCVKKANGKLRVCADFSTGLNAALEAFEYPLPLPEDIFASLNGGVVFSQIDFSDAYLQIELSEEAKKLVVINTHRGLYQYNRLPFGIKTAPGIFQSIMNKMLCGLKGVTSYLDDVIVVGKDETDHKMNLIALFERIAEYGFRVRLEKCSFSQSEITYLGFIVDRNGRRPNPEKLAAIKQMVEPRNETQVRAFLGMITYYSTFLPELKEARGPLDELLKKDVKFEWKDIHKKSFGKLKAMLTNDMNLTHYDPKQTLVVAADACDYGIGCVISHRFLNGTEKPIAHASRSLTPAERNYSQIEKEALGLIYAIKKFHKYVFGRKFILLTDHKPLLSIFGNKKGVPVYSANRLMRWATILIGYDFEIQYVNTVSFGQADALSRLMQSHPVAEEDTVVASIETEMCSALADTMKSLPLTAENVREHTVEDKVLKKLKKILLSGQWPKKIDDGLKPYHNKKDTLSLVSDCIMMVDRVVIPESLRKKVLTELHKGHPGMVRMKSLARGYVYWPGIDKDCEELVKRCSRCQLNLKSPTKVTLQAWPTPEAVWQRIHIDFAGPVEGTYYLVVVDAKSKWPEMLPMTNITAGNTVKSLMSLFVRYGMPQTIVSDNGTQFTSDRFNDMCKQNGILHVRNAPYHPQSNGQAERFVDILKRGLQKIKGEETPEVVMNRLLLSYRSTPSTRLSGKTPAEVFLGRKLRTTLSLLIPSKKPSHFVVDTKMEAQFNTKHGAKMREFVKGELVSVKEHSGLKWKWVKGKILKRIGTVNYLVQIRDSVHKRHANQIRLSENDDDESKGETSLLTLLDMFDIPCPAREDETVTVNPDIDLPGVQVLSPARASPLQPTLSVPLRKSTRTIKPVVRFDNSLY